ncbi:MAG: hypothetical protein EP329_04155, partial [Deltaproteobacteria bacterium]
MNSPRLLWPAPLAALALFACTGGTTPSGPAGRLSVDVAPLNLSGLTDADYVLTVTNGPGGTGDVVWTRALTSQQYGDGAGSASYVGTCDAATGVNTVTLELTALYDASGELPVASYMNPTPISREVSCVADTDVAVQFDIALARRAQQGFFDVAVQFEDVFCSAKLDCEDDAGNDLELLHTAAGARGMTVVMGFACTGAPEGETYLYLDDLVIDCTEQTLDVRIDPTGQGNVTPSADPGGYLFGAAVYRGVEQLAGKAYWNVSLGLDVDHFAANGTCTLHTRGTASRTPFPQAAEGFPLPEGSVYPVIDWTVDLSDATGRLCHRYALDGGTEVETQYLGYLPPLNAFTWSPGPIHLRHRFRPATGEVLSAGAPICNPACGHGVCVSDVPSNTCDCTGTGYSGATCDTPVCTAPCLNGGTCVAPDTCDCAGTGFEGATCADDVDECTVGSDNCDVNATCTNTVGGFTCACDSGYTGDGVTCADVDECTLGSDNCDANATCTNTVGGFTCACDSGYTGDGVTCADVDECTLGSDNCDVNATCTNTVGAFTCACDAYWTGDGVTCADIDECATDNGGCGAASAWTCTNNVGAAPTCTDIDECAAGTDDCDVN